jgi:hypothetical protein
MRRRGVVVWWCGAQSPINITWGAPATCPGGENVAVGQGWTVRSRDFDVFLHHIVLYQVLYSRGIVGIR